VGLAASPPAIVRATSQQAPRFDPSCDPSSSCWLFLLIPSVGRSTLRDRQPNLLCGRGARGQDDVRRERDQFRRIFAHVVGIARAPTIIDPNVAAVDPTRLL